MARVSLDSSSICPYCGQRLHNSGAVERLRKNEAERMAELRQRLENKSLQKLEKLEAELETVKATSAQEKAAVSKDAERQAEKKVAQRLQLLERAVTGRDEESKRLKRRIERLTAHDRGDAREEDVFERLCIAFREDDIKRAGRSGDVLHNVYDSAGSTRTKAGLIIYECKDTSRWSNEFLTQIRRAGEAHHSSHLVLVTTAFPRGENGEVCVRNGVVIVRPGRLVDLAEIIRQAVLEISRAGASGDDQARKSSALYAYLSSQEFRQEFATLVRITDDLGKLLEKEQVAHSRVWQKRRQAYDELRTKVVGVHSRVRSIVQGKASHRGEVVKLARSGTG